MSFPPIRLKKGEDRRIRAGHPWIYSNEIDIAATPLKGFSPGQEVLVEAPDQSIVGIAYVNPHSLITARMLSLDPQMPIDHAFFLKRFQDALTLRERLFTQPYYRLVFSEADYLPGLVVDRFANDFVIQINTAGMELKQDHIISALRELFPDIHSILLRNDSKIRIQEGLENYVKPGFGTPPEEITLEENGVRFMIPFLQGQKTGWFYDHRLNRERLKHYVANQTVLDVFSYVGGWGIQAAMFGAKQVTCVETSELAGQFIKKNAALNDVADKVKVLCEDAFDALKRLVQEKKQYDVIVLDPPAFINRFKDRKEGTVAYQRLNELAVKLLVPNGILFTCSCSMHFSMEDMIEMLQRVAYRTQSKLQLLERGHQGPDHPLHIAIPETNYLKSIIVRKIG